jgi:rhamnosyl/mannosyltransferase
MKVLHVGKYFPPVPGGIETLLKRLLDATANRVENVVVVANAEDIDRIDRYDGYEVHRLARRGEFLLNPVVPGLPRFLRRTLAARVDIVALHFPNLMATVGYLIARPLPGPEKLVIFYHSEVVFDRFPWNVMGKMYYVFERLLLERADRIVVASPNMAAISPQLPRYRDKISLVHYALEERWTELTAEQRKRSESIRYEHGDRLVLFVGRLVPYKGTDVLLSAARDIRGKILIVGDGPLMEGLRNRVRREGLDGKVVLAGNVADLKPYFHACDLLVLPSVSHLEAFGIVQMEAMAFGKPSVSSDLQTGVTYINLPGRTGLSFPVGDATKLAGAVNRLLDDGELRRRLGEQARERVLLNFSQAAVGRKILDLYIEVAGAV